MKVLVALDQSECSQLALDAIISRCWPERTSFKLVHVIDPFDPIEPDATIAKELWSSMIDNERSQRRLRAENMLQTAVSRILRTHADSEVTTDLSDGYMPDQSILEIASEWKADLVVLGSHSRRGLNRLLLGSVSQSVLLNAPCSVEIVKSTKEKSVSQTFNVLICLDDSPFSEAAFQAVLRRPWTQNTVFKLITVMKPVLDACMALESSITVLGMLSDADAAKTEAQNRLAAKAAELRTESGLEVQVEVLDGDARHSILQVTEKWPAHLVLVGSHGRTGLNRLLLGSVSQAVSLHAPCSVEVVKLPVNQAPVHDKVAVASQSSTK